MFRRTGSHPVRTFAIGVYGYGGAVVGEQIERATLRSTRPVGTDWRHQGIGTRAREQGESESEGGRSRARHSAGERDSGTRAGCLRGGRIGGAGWLDGGGGQLGASAGLAGGDGAPGPRDAGTAAGGPPATAASQTRLRLQVSPASQGGLHWGAHCPATHAKPGEQIGSQARSGGATAGGCVAVTSAAGVRLTRIDRSRNARVAVT